MGVVKTVPTDSIPATPSQFKFQPGQVWGFKSPPGQSPKARLIVLRVEQADSLGLIVHVALTGVSYGNGQDSIQHLPFSESAIEQSVTQLERESAPIPDYAEGYKLWREAFDAGKGGVFTLPVAEVFTSLTGMVSEKK